MDNKLILHVATEIVIIGSITYVFNKKINELKNEVAEINKKYKDLEQKYVQVSKGLESVIHFMKSQQAINQGVSEYDVAITNDGSFTGYTSATILPLVQQEAVARLAAAEKSHPASQQQQPVPVKVQQRRQPVQQPASQQQRQPVQQPASQQRRQPAPQPTSQQQLYTQQQQNASHPAQQQPQQQKVQVSNVRTPTQEQQSSSPKQALNPIQQIQQQMAEQLFGNGNNGSSTSSLLETVMQNASSMLPAVMSMGMGIVVPDTTEILVAVDMSNGQERSQKQGMNSSDIQITVEEDSSQLSQPSSQEQSYDNVDISEEMKRLEN